MKNYHYLILNNTQSARRMATLLRLKTIGEFAFFIKKTINMTSAFNNYNEVDCILIVECSNFCDLTIFLNTTTN